MNSSLKSLFLLISLLSSTFAFALSPSEKNLAEAAGEYYAAIMLAKEFKKTKCGGIRIASKWTDVEKAKDDIFRKLPKNLHAEMRREWASFNAQAQSSVSQALQMFNSDKAVAAGCDRVQGVFWTTFDAAVKRWQSF
jgi:hypothetical protein